MKQGRKSYGTLIDLSKLGLGSIVEKEDAFEIGAMVTLRQMETDPSLDKAFGGVFARMLSPIVGTQFRNCATDGGTEHGRYGFSDIITLLLVLDTTVLLSDRQVPLEAYCQESRKKDLILGIRIRKQNIRVGYQAFRRTATDLPVLTCAVSRAGEKYKVAVGARPGLAKLCGEAALHLKKGDVKAAQADVTSMTFGTNMRGTAAYRKLLAPTLLRRAFKEMGGDAR